MFADSLPVVYRLHEGEGRSQLAPVTEQGSDWVRRSTSLLHHGRGGLGFVGGSMGGRIDWGTK